ncbi:YeeE/YedE family protein [Tumidithrix elongata RA019]|uniref:YeeE/YedE family protein n=1 Tax=Tumidithrix elongata BACA0141 TaxID=2716417 RepID=A0AAW9PZD6_9CYAN|nr:YeeE/YedE family protein [Tumidithrix elongata RA019]
MANSIQPTAGFEAWFLRPKLQQRITAIALLIFIVGAIALSQFGWRQSALFIVGGLLGLTLYAAKFSFTGAYRKVLVERDPIGMYAQFLAIAIAAILFAPTLAAGSVFEQDVSGAIAPLGGSVSFGAFLFGIGMQFATGCGCGTLYTVGAGSTTMLFTLATFGMGAFAASLTRSWWTWLPSGQAIALNEVFGWQLGLLVQLGLAIVAIALLYGWRRSKSTELNRQPIWSALRTQKKLFFGAIALAILNWLVLILSGQPWRITWGFALWSAHIAKFVGWNATTSQFWQGEFAQAALNQSVFADATSVTNLGIILGALLAAAIAGKFVPKAIGSVSAIVFALIGGLLMGYGAFLSFGCNVNAFFGGIASGSLHGWLWIAFALFGSFVGIRLRSPIIV